MIEEEHILEWDEYLDLEEYARDAGHAWWQDEILATHDAYGHLLADTGYGVDLPARVKLEGSAAAAQLAQLRWYVHRISDLLENPAEPAYIDHRTGEDCGGGLTALELAQELLSDARRLLAAAAHRSSELRALSWMLAVSGRRATLAAHQIATDSLTRRDHAACEHITQLTLTDTLESASHAPPRMEVIRTAALPSTAGRLQPG